MMKKSAKGSLLALCFIIAFQESTSTSTLDRNNTSSIWTDIGRIFGFLMEKCLSNNPKDFNQSHFHDNTRVIIEDCLKRRGLRALDRALGRDSIAITDNIVLVKRKNDTELYDQSGRYAKRTRNKKQLWSEEFIEKIVNFLKTRLIRISFPRRNSTTNEVEGRHRHKNSGLGPMLMFGLVAAGLIVIPMGFQFLAVLGGKALLLAKLALLLTSIQGLKKIATSNMNYGLYSTGHGGSPWLYDRQWRYETDRFPSSYYSSSGSGTQFADHYLQTSMIPPVYHNLNPRGEEYLNSQ